MMDVFLTFQVFYRLIYDSFNGEIICTESVRDCCLESKLFTQNNNYLLVHKPLQVGHNDGGQHKDWHRQDHTCEGRLHDCLRGKKTMCTCFISNTAISRISFSLS